MKPMPREAEKVGTLIIIMMKIPVSFSIQLIEESKKLCVKYTALKNVSVLTETVVPPCKPTAFK